MSSSRGWLRYWKKPRFIDWSSSCSSQKRSERERESARREKRTRLEEEGRKQKEGRKALKTNPVDVQINVRSPGSTASPKPENLPLPKIEEDSDGGVASAQEKKNRKERSVKAR